MTTDLNVTAPAPEQTPEPRPSWTARLNAHATRLWDRWVAPHGIATPSTPADWAAIALLVATIGAGALFLAAKVLAGAPRVIEGGIDWVSADVAGLVTEPVKTYIATHHDGLPVNAATLWWTWKATAVVFLLLATATGNLGARIGWVLHGAATTAMVYAGTPGPARATAAAITVIGWCLLSIAALRRTRRHVTHVDQSRHTFQHMVFPSTSTEGS